MSAVMSATLFISMPAHFNCDLCGKCPISHSVLGEYIEFQREQSKATPCHPIIYSEEMVVTAHIFVASRVTGAILLPALADLGFALRSAGAFEHTLPVVDAVKPCCLPDANLQIWDIRQG